MSAPDPRTPEHGADPRTPDGDERAPWQAPELTVLASVEEATLGVTEAGADAGGMFS